MKSIIYVQDKQSGRTIAVNVDRIAYVENTHDKRMAATSHTCRICFSAVGADYLDVAAEFDTVIEKIKEARSTDD